MAFIRLYIKESVFWCIQACEFIKSKIIDLNLMIDKSIDSLNHVTIVKYHIIKYLRLT
jgi:hypothetical protein